MLAIDKDKVGILAVGKDKVASLWLITKEGAVKIWDAVNDLWGTVEKWGDSEKY